MKKYLLLIASLFCFNLFSMSSDTYVDYSDNSELEINFTLEGLIDALHKGDIYLIQNILDKNPNLLINKTVSNRNIFDYIESAQDFYEDEELDLYSVRLKLIDFLFVLLEVPKKESILNSKDRKYWKKVLRCQLGFIKFNSEMKKRERDNYFKKFKKLK
jgi:hypothetical protein